MNGHDSVAWATGVYLDIDRLSELGVLDSIRKLLEETKDLRTSRGRLYHDSCAECHGGGGVSGTKGIPDLRMTALPYEAFDAVVRQGLKAANGMPNLGRWVTAADTAAIKKWLESVPK